MIKNRKDLLALSTKQSEEVIRVNLTEEDLAQRKSEAMANLLKQQELEDEFAEVKAAHQAKIKSLKSATKVLMSECKLKFIDQRMIVHNVPNDENATVEFYDSEATLVGYRPMTFKEKQSTEFHKLSKVSGE